MQLKYPIIILVFYLLAILQNSFLPHFNLFGAMPNIVFIAFFLLLFFSLPNSLEHIFYSLTAGFFLDVFSNTYFGLSMISLFLIGFLTKKIQSLLKNIPGNDDPFIYFLPLFAVFFVFYSLVSSLGGFSLPGLIYNIAVALFIFWFYKKVFYEKVPR